MKAAATDLGVVTLDAFRAEPGHALSWAGAAAAGSQMELAEEVVAAIDAERGLLVTVPPADVLACVDGILLARRPAAGLELLARLGVLDVWLPEVAALIGFHDSCEVHHKDLWAHTVAVIEKMHPDADLRWAALMHDSGKIATRRVSGGKVSFLRHEALGGLLMVGAAARVQMPPERAARVTFVIANHGRINAYTPDWSDNAVRRLVRAAGPHLQDLLRFSSADWTTKRTTRAARIRKHLNGLTQRIAALEAAATAPRPLPVGLGGHIVRALELTPGPLVGEHLRWLEAEVSAGRLPQNAEHEVYLDALRRRIAAADQSRASGRP